MGHNDIRLYYESQNSYVLPSCVFSPAHSNSASLEKWAAEAEVDACTDSQFSQCSIHSVTLPSEDRGHRALNTSVEEESMVSNIENDRETIIFKCPIVVYNLRHGNCPCTSISQTFNIGDPSRVCWISEALHSSRGNHLVSGTGEWLLNSPEYRAWLENSYSSMLWLRGSAGTGKSMLASATLNHLKANPRPGDITIFYFSDGRFRHGHAVRNILWTILLGLKSRKTSDDSFSCLEALSVEMQNTGSRLEVSQLRRFFSTMRHDLKSHETLVLIVDMLDDYDLIETGLSELLRQFQDLASSLDQRHRIKFFVSSRPAMFQRNVAAGTLQVDLDNEPLSRQDLMAYARHGLQSLDICLPPRDLNLLSNQLIDQARGTFLWVNLQLRDLSDKAISLELLLDLISTIPSNVSEIYDRMVARIARNDHFLAHIVFTWITHSVRPISLAELNDIAHFDTVLTESDIWRISGGLVILAEDQTMQLVHLSAKEYLSSPQNELQGFATHKDPHEMIAHMCLRSLSGVDLLRSLGLYSTSSLPQTTRAHPIHTQSYAISFWKLHYHLAEPHSNRLPGFLHSCLKEALERDSESFKGYISVSPITLVRLGNRQGGDLPDANTCAALNSYVSDTVLVIAATFGFDRIARLELQMGAHANQTHGAGNLTALHLASKNGHRRVVETLLLYGATVNAFTSGGYTPLYYAAISGRHDILKVLIEHEAALGSSHFYDRMTSLSHRSGQSVFRNYLIESAISESCADCGQMRANYTVSNWHIQFVALGCCSLRLVLRLI
jgi:hypothetical protein